MKYIVTFILVSILPQIVSATESRCPFSTNETLEGVWQSIDTNESSIYQINISKEVAILAVSSGSGYYTWSAKTSNLHLNNGILHGEFVETNKGSYSSAANIIRVAGTSVSCPGENSSGTMHLILDGYVRHFFVHSRVFSKISGKSIPEELLESQRKIEKEVLKIKSK